MTILKPTALEVQVELDLEAAACWLEPSVIRSLADYRNYNATFTIPHTSRAY